MICPRCFKTARPIPHEFGWHCEKHGDLDRFNLDSEIMVVVVQPKRAFIASESYRRLNEDGTFDKSSAHFGSKWERFAP